MVGNVNFFMAVHLVAMLDGVDQRLFEGEADAENLTFLDAVSFQGTFNILLNAARFARIARNHPSRPNAAVTWSPDLVSIFRSRSLTSPSEKAAS